MKKKITLFIVLALLFLNSYSQIQDPEFVLSSEEVETLMRGVFSEIGENEFLHIFYKEVYNDSTFLIQVFSNDISQVQTHKDIVIKNVNNVNIFHYLKYFYLYKKRKVSKKLDQFIFDNGSKSLFLLVRRRHNRVNFMKLSYWSYPSSKEFNDDESQF